MPRVAMPDGRKVKYKGFDFFEDQLEAIAKVAKMANTTQANVVRMALDAQFKLPKQSKNETTI